MRFAVAGMVGLAIITFVTTFSSKGAHSDAQSVAILRLSIGLACLTGVLAIVLAIYILYRRHRKVLLGFPFVGLVTAGYCLLFVQVAFHERERTWELVRCAARLQEIRAAVDAYERANGKLPRQMADLDLAEHSHACSTTEQGYVLWPDGMPDTRAQSTPGNVVIAREATPGHLSHWFLLFAPVRVIDNPNHPSLVEYPAAHREQRRRDAVFYCNTRCKGSLEITRVGVRIPGTGSGPDDPQTWR